MLQIRKQLFSVIIPFFHPIYGIKVKHLEFYFVEGKNI